MASIATRRRKGTTKPPPIWPGNARSTGLTNTSAAEEFVNSPFRTSCSCGARCLALRRKQSHLKCHLPGIASHGIPLSAENQLRGAARNHVGRRVCSRPRDDVWHHRGVRHAQIQNAVHAEFWVDDREFVHAHFARTDCVSKTRRGKSGQFPDILGTRIG